MRKTAVLATILLELQVKSGYFPLDHLPAIDDTHSMKTIAQFKHKNTDSKGRVTLGSHFANRDVIIEHRSADEVIVRLARVIPENESWLYKNPKALAAVRIGLEEAREGKVAEKPPDLKAAAKLAKQLED
jgi:hypothetical protein